MEILFIPKGKADELMNLSIDEFDSKELNEIKSELREIDKDFSLKGVNLGVGADWVLILAVMNGITSVLILGDKIDKGIEGWIKIGKRIKNIFSKSDKVYVDKDAAKFLAISYLANKYKIRSIELLKESEISIKDLSTLLRDRNSADFIAKPYKVYLMTFEVNEHIIIILGVRSDGQANLHYEFDKNEFLPF